jgi:hypothetical protein
VRQHLAGSAERGGVRGEPQRIEVVEDAAGHALRAIPAVGGRGRARRGRVLRAGAALGGEGRCAK